VQLVIPAKLIQSAALQVELCGALPIADAFVE